MRARLDNWEQALIRLTEDIEQHDKAGFPYHERARQWLAIDSHVFGWAYSRRLR